MDKEEKEKVQEIIIEFLETSFNKKVVLIPKSRVHVYECKVANSKTSAQIVNEAFSVTSFPELTALMRQSPLVFIGRNYVTADKDQEVAIQRLHGIYLKRDPNLFEVSHFKGYWIVWD